MSALYSNKAKKGRRVTIAFFICLGIGAAIALHHHDRLHLLFNRDEIVCWLENLGPWSVMGFIGAHIVATAVGVPGTVLVLAGGVVFGVFYGTLWSVVGATLGAIAAFALTRTLLRDFITKRWGHSSQLQKLNHRLGRSPLAVVLAVRFAPISPFNVVNFLFGLTPISLRTYALGTFMGIIPGTALYTWTGSSGAEMLSGGNPVPFAIAISALGILSILPFVCGRKYQ
ncbi:MAG: TVP38/TMEM64 family protein [Cyanobacteria bacterium P01_F01_bin.153]